MERPTIMRRKSAILLGIALSVGLISSGLHAAKKAEIVDAKSQSQQVMTIKKA